MARNSWHGIIWALLAVMLIPAGNQALAVQLMDSQEPRQSALHGDPVAQHTMGEMCRKGQGTDQDLKQAIFWYTRAALGGHADSQYQLGVMYETGSGVPQNYSEARTWYGKAAKQGHSDALSKLEAIRNYLDSLKKSAERGEADAQCTLGDMYAQGNGVRQDAEQAVTWYRKAAEQGNAQGQDKLGGMYAQGHGVVKDDGEAVAWYRKAAEQGNAEAEYHLSGMYFKGRGVAQDAATSFAWLELAAAHGQANAAMEKAFVASRLTPEQMAKARALVEKRETLTNKKP